MIEALGWVAAAVGVASALPQMVRILRMGTASGVSLLLWQLSAATTGSWAVHGYLVDAPQMQLPNVAMSLLSGVIVVLVARDRASSLAWALGLPVLVAAGLALVNLGFGALVFGIAVAAPQLVGQVAQLRDLVVSREVRGVSGAFLAVFLFVQSLWWVFGLLTMDWALIVCAGAMVLAASANLGMYLVRRLRAARAEVARSA